ncbi:MAG: hypothetical protein J6X53_00290 [Abditibacteriota bacterium]|nr:hypothetical protein [Abditibacteriota bacterium]
MAKKKVYDCCPYCGQSDLGVYSKVFAAQYYDWYGNACGFSHDIAVSDETKGVYCPHCHKRITTLNRLEQQGRETGLFEE